MGGSTNWKLYGSAKKILPLKRLIHAGSGDRMFTSECRKQGHIIRTVDGEKKNLVYQKGDARPSMDYYSGIYKFCVREDCEWNQYSGSTQPYKRVLLTDNKLEVQNGNRNGIQKESEETSKVVLSIFDYFGTRNDWPPDRDVCNPRPRRERRCVENPGRQGSNSTPQKH